MSVETELDKNERQRQRHQPLTCTSFALVCLSQQRVQLPVELGRRFHETAKWKIGKNMHDHIIFSLR